MRIRLPPRSVLDDYLKVQILVLGLSHRDPGIAVHRHLTTPLAGIPEVWLSASGVATGFSSHPLSYDKGEFTARAAGLRDHAAGPAALQRHVGEVHRLGNRAGASRL